MVEMIKKNQTNKHGVVKLSRVVGAHSQSYLAGTTLLVIASVAWVTWANAAGKPQ